MSNEYYRLLVETKWVKKVWKVLPTTQVKKYSPPIRTFPPFSTLLRTTSQDLALLHTNPHYSSSRPSGSRRSGRYSPLLKKVWKVLPTTSVK
jgi:hypothetical protein